MVCSEWDECEDGAEGEMVGVSCGVLFDVLGVAGYKECANVPGVK